MTTTRSNLDNSKPLVSIICLAYNHESFIRKTLDGILSQKVDFAVEILIHDDASTDRTAMIISEYASRFPKQLTPILQTDNQYSKGIRNTTKLIMLARGRYIAFCECDDYWTDPEKLSLQVRILEADTTLSGCFHSTEWLDDQKGEIISELQLPQPMRKARFNLDDLLEFGCIPHTSSIMYRKDKLKRIGDIKRGRCTGDYSFCLLATLDGDLAFIDRSMSVYRAHSGGSWSPRSTNKKIEWAIEGLIDISKELGLSKKSSYRRGLARYRLSQSDRARRRGSFWDAARRMLQAIQVAPWVFRKEIIGHYLQRFVGNKRATKGWGRP